MFLSCSFGQLAGTYTIGNNSANYLTIQAAITALNTVGVSGPVIFNIQPGAYNTSVTFSSIVGASPTNTITFKSENDDSTSVQIQGFNMISFSSNASNIYFRRLTFELTGSSTAPDRAVIITSNASNIGISNCVFTGGSIVLGSYFLGLSETSKESKSYISVTGATNFTLENNRFDSNGAALYKRGTWAFNNVNINNNVLSGSLPYPFMLSMASNVTMNRNQFLGDIQGTALTVSYYSGTFELNENSFIASKGAYIRAVQTPSNNSISVKNNFFSSVDRGLELIDINTMSVYNNSFYSLNSSCLGIDHNTPTTSSLVILNNIFSRSTILQPALFIPDNYPLSSLTSNNNAFSHDVKAAGLTSGQWSAITVLYDLDAWILYSNQDQASVVVGQVYSSNTDVHTPNAILLDGGAQSVVGVATDIDQQTRNLLTPDIGADEFTMDFNTFVDLELVEIFDPNVSCNSSDTLFLMLTNNSFITINSFKVVTSFNESGQTILPFFVTIAAGDTIILPVPQCRFRDNTWYEQFSCRVIEPNGILDNNQSNDYGELTNVFRLKPFKILEENENNIECPIQLLTVPFVPFSTISWSTGSSTWSITVTTPGIYSATVTSPIGCQLVESITIY